MGVQMPAHVINNDRDYQQWLSQNPDGFVVNTTRSRSPRYMMLHRASCRHISDPMHESEGGGFTERDYIKVVAQDVASLLDWIAANGRPERTFSSECGHCRP